MTMHRRSLQVQPLSVIRHLANLFHMYVAFPSWAISTRFSIHPSHFSPSDRGGGGSCKGEVFIENFAKKLVEVKAKLCLSL